MCSSPKASIGFMFFFAVILLSCRESPNSKLLESHRSPSGDYNLEIELGNRNNSNEKYILMFKLRTSIGKELDYINTGASDVMKWAVTWYNKEVVILNSSDIGTYAWTISRDGKMIKVWPVTQDMMLKGDEAFKMKYRQ